MSTERSEVASAVETPTDGDPPELVAYVEHQRLRNLAPRTTLRRLANWLERPLSEATPADLRAFLARPPRPIARVTHMGHVSILKAFYAALAELGWVEVSPALGLRCERVHSSRRPLSSERVRELLGEASQVRGVAGRGPTRWEFAVAQRDRACLELLFGSGMRASEVAATRVVDLDLEEGSVLVRRAKRGKPRRIPLPEPAVRALRSYVEEGRAALVTGVDRAKSGCSPRDEGRLFLGARGRPFTRAGVLQLVRRVSGRCGTKTYPHALRRTLATELVRFGASLPAVQELLGHAHLTTTAEYVEVSLPDMREALDAFDRRPPASHNVSGDGLALLHKLQSQLFTEWQFSAA